MCFRTSLSVSALPSTLITYVHHHLQACFQGDAHASAPASQKDELIYSLLMLQVCL